MELIQKAGIDGERRDYYKYPIAIPPQEKSDYIEQVLFDRFRYHSGEGDMWPMTWAADDMIYCGAGDNNGCSMNLWKLKTFRFCPGALTNTGDWGMEMINPEPVTLSRIYGKPEGMGIKPSGLLDLAGTLYMSVEVQNYGDNPFFGRQRNICGWIIRSRDGGKTFDEYATNDRFFEGRLSSCHFLQYGRGYAGAPDDYVYAYFPFDGEDRQSYWENNDGLLLGRVPKDRILNREAWEFYAGQTGGRPVWKREEREAEAVFTYYKMTGANHVTYNPGLGRYLMGNYSFIDENLHPRPIHQMRYPESHISQLTLFEAEHPWGPWKLFYRDDNWGTYGDYQPNFPAKWMSGDGRIVYMASSGSWDDYNLVVQKAAFRLAGDKDFPAEAKYFCYRTERPARYGKDRAEAEQFQDTSSGIPH